MGEKGLRATLQAVLAIAHDQHGVVTRAQLFELGLTAPAITHRLATGRLHRVHTGIYAVGRPGLGQRGRWMAAVLASGDGAALCGEAGAGLWQLRPAAFGSVDVAVPASAFRVRPGIHCRRRASLAQHVRVVDGIAVVDPVFVLVDLAISVRTGELEAMINEADKRSLLTPAKLRAAVDRIPRRPGVGALRDLLDRQTFVLTESELKRCFKPLARRAGLPLPETRVHVGGYRVDFFWPQIRLVVETDGGTFHRTPPQQLRDRRRDQTHLVSGLTPLRFTHPQVRFEPAYVVKTLRAVTRRLL